MAVVQSADGRPDGDRPIVLAEKKDDRARFGLGNGNSIRFWTDHWQGTGSFQQRFPNLFHIASAPDALVSQVFNGSNWDVSFRRCFGSEEARQWVQLRRETQNLAPSNDRDRVS